MDTATRAEERLICADAYGVAASATGSDRLATAESTLDTDGPAIVGLWEAGPGEDTDVEVDEVFLVLAGAGIVSFVDGSVIELRPGVVVRLRAGDQTRWVITERIRKLYIIARG